MDLFLTFHWILNRLKPWDGFGMGSERASEHLRKEMKIMKIKVRLQLLARFHFIEHNSQFTMQFLFCASRQSDFNFISSTIDAINLQWFEKTRTFSLHSLISFCFLQSSWWWIFNRELIILGLSSLDGELISC